MESLRDNRETAQSEASNTEFCTIEEVINHLGTEGIGITPPIRRQIEKCIQRDDRSVIDLIKHLCQAKEDVWDGFY
jgi:hypothetical protein